MRYRETNSRKNAKTSSPLTTVNYDGTTNSSTSNLSWNYPVGTFKSISDRVTPNFRQRIARGEVINNPYSTFEETAKLSLSSRSYTQAIPQGGNPPAYKNGYSASWTNSNICLSVRGGPLGHIKSTYNVAYLKTLAGTQAHANIDAATFEGGVFVAELNETLRFLRNPLKNWGDFLKEVKTSKNKSRFGRGKTVADFIGSNWLGYRYAVRPLVSDIQDVIKAVEDSVKKHPVRRTARGSASFTENLSTYVVRPASEGQEFTYQTQTTHMHSVRAGVLYETYRSPDTFGLALHDVPISLWEAVRFSFILDWFANIGPWIEAITPVGGVRILTSWTTVITESTTQCQSYWSKGGTKPGFPPRVIGGDAQTDEELVTRAKSRNPGTEVGLSFTSMPLAGVRGTARLIDLVAISSQLLSSR